MTDWTPVYVAAAELADDGRLSGEHPLDMIEAGFTAGAAWTRTVAGAREVDLAGFAAVTVTTRGPARPVRDSANWQAASAYREKEYLDAFAATLESAEQRAVVASRSSHLQSIIDRTYAKSV